MLLSCLFLHRLAYECFLRIHQSLAILLLYSIWRHLPESALLPRRLILVSLGSFTITSLIQIISFCYRSALFTSRGHPRAYISCNEIDDGNDEHGKSEENDMKSLRVQVALPRPMKLDAGQYVSLWMPMVNFWSWTQVHLFMVTSWSRGKQIMLDLDVEA